MEADACDLSPLAAARFHPVDSVSGAMFAPRPLDVARGMVRVTRPGGRIVMGNWIPGDPTMVAQILKLLGEYGPPPPEGFVPPTAWGVEANVVERFGQAGIPPDAIVMEPAFKEFRLDAPPSGLLEMNYFGPMMRVFESLGPGARADELRGKLQAMMERENQAAAGKTMIRARYLLVTITVPDPAT